jgi:hypothetical protein
MLSLHYTIGAKCPIFPLRARETPGPPGPHPAGPGTERRKVPRMPITMTLPDEITYQVPGHEAFTHSLADHTPEMVMRGFAHGLRQMIIDSASMTKEEQAALSADEVTAKKRDLRLKAFGNRLAWLRADPRMQSDDSIWMTECRAFLTLLQVGAKARMALKNVADGKAALLATGGPIAGESYILTVTHNADKKKKALSDGAAAVAAMVAEAMAAKAEAAE